MKPGMVVFRTALNHGERTAVDVNRRSRQEDAGSFSVLDENARVVDDDGCPRGAFEDDASGRTLQVANHDGILLRGLQNNARARRVSGQCYRGYVRSGVPETARPNGMVRIALLEFDPYTGTLRWHEERAHLLSSEGNAGHCPARRAGAGNIGNDGLYTAQEQGIDIVDDGTAIFSEKFHRVLETARRKKKTQRRSGTEPIFLCDLF